MSIAVVRLTPAQVLSQLETLSMADALRMVAAKYDMSWDEIVGMSRKPRCTVARHEHWLRMHDAGYSPYRIAQAYGVHYSTVRHALFGRKRRA